MSSNVTFPNTHIKSPQEGFTLIELVIVVAIIAIIAAVGLPSYQSSVTRSHRMDMMTDMENIGTTIAQKKIAYRQYKNIPVTSLQSSSYEYYTVEITPSPLTKDWSIIATPKAGLRMADDGTLTLDADNNKCLDTLCGEGWKD